MCYFQINRLNGVHFYSVRLTMSVIGKKLNPIQSGGGHGDENTSTTNSQPSSVTPDDVLRLTTITEDYLCSSGSNDFIHKCPLLEQ